MNVYDKSPDVKLSGKCGVKHVEDFSQLRCPVCGQQFMLKELDVSNEPENELDVISRNVHTDDAGISHFHAWGRNKQIHQDKVHMFCPNKCVEEIIFNVENTTYGHYRELTELEQHYAHNT